MRNLVATVSIVTISLFGLTACGEKEEDLVQVSGSTGSSGAGEGSGSSGASDAENSESVTETDLSGDNDRSAAEDENKFGSASECIIGSWQIDNSKVGSLFTGAEDGLDIGITLVGIEGSASVTFEKDGKLLVDYAGWKVSYDSPEGSMSLSRDGADGGTYTADNDGELFMEVNEMGALVTVDFGSFQGSEAGTPDSATGEYVCDSETLEITAGGDTTLLNRK